jgi:hypothetical protein
MQYLSESTRHLLQETTSKLVKTGKDPVFFVEAFMLKHPNRFNEGALGNFWRDVKNWWKGGTPAVAAGRHDLEAEYENAYKALETMTNHILKFKGSDPSTEEDVINLLNTTLDNLQTARPVIQSLAGKVKKRAAAAHDPSIFGGPEAYKPYVHVEDFADLPATNIDKPGGTKPIMGWFASLKKNGKDSLFRSIIMNAKVRMHPAHIVSLAEKDFEKLKTATDPVIVDLDITGVRNREMYGRVFAYLYAKLAEAKKDPSADIEKDPEGTVSSIIKDLPSFKKEVYQFNPADTKNMLEFLDKHPKTEVQKVLVDAEKDLAGKPLTRFILQVNKINQISKDIAAYKAANPTSALTEMDEEKITRMLIYLVDQSKSTTR